MQLINGKKFLQDIILVKTSFEVIIFVNAMNQSHEKCTKDANDLLIQVLVV